MKCPRDATVTSSSIRYIKDRIKISKKAVCVMVPVCFFLKFLLCNLNLIADTQDVTKEITHPKIIMRTRLPPRRQFIPKTISEKTLSGDVTCVQNALYYWFVFILVKNLNRMHRRLQNESGVIIAYNPHNLTIHKIYKSAFLGGELL